MHCLIRNFAQPDLEHVRALNEDVVPAVNSLNIDQVSWFAEHAIYFKVAEIKGQFSGFLIGLRAGLDYDSPNYQYFRQRHSDFAYVDRVAVAGHARRSGLASRLYEDFGRTLHGKVDRMACEVNIEPPNEASMRFHERMGFKQVGVSGAGAKQVAYLEKLLD